MILNRLQLLLVLVLVAEECCVSGHHLTPPSPALFSAVSALHCLGLLLFPPLLGPGLGMGGAPQHFSPGLETGFWITARLSTIGTAL